MNLAVIRKTLFLLAVGTLLGAALFSASAADDFCSAPVPTAQGPVIGQAEKNLAACSYKGIPYAAPPVGELRWKTPEPPASHSGVLEATAFGPACVQDEKIAGHDKSWSFSEDCLTLNIWRPAKAGAFPVMFWIHYGGYITHTGRDEMFQGGRLAAERDVVVVTINYRLGSLGFLALPELAAEDPNGSTGNYGLLDTIQALKWVRDNIAGFGGDPKNVTIFGCSAGGVSVSLLLAAPPAAGLFHRGIIESGGFSTYSQVKGYQQGKEFIQTLGCQDSELLPCLRSKSAKEVIAAAPGQERNCPHVDGYVLPMKPVTLIQQGKFNRMPVMVGNNKNEANLLLLEKPGMVLLSRGMVTKKLQKSGGPFAGETLQMYSYEDYRWPMELMLAAVTDWMHGRAFAAAEALSPQTPVYGYRFDWNWDQERRGMNWGAFHGLEVPLVFGNLDLKKKVKSSSFMGYPNTKAAEKAGPLSEQMMSYWTNFAKTGDPNGPDLPTWPVYHPEQKELIHLDTPISTAPLTAAEIQRYQYFADLESEEGCPETVATEQGPVKGFTESGIAACSYKGIPYAAPPVGELRWKAPEPPPAREGVFEARSFGPSCPQDEIFGSGGKSQAFSEDCLTLNIYRPARSGKFPVMFWIHGGGYVIGAGSYEMYNGARLAAEREVVVVSINYRLGALGFLALPELAQEDPHRSTGNYGFLDQVAALEWVRDNIAHFAGDPNNVTIFGESAGGGSVCELLASPLAANLFHQGIIESGSCDFSQTLAKGYEHGRKFAASVGCAGDDARACLRSLPADKLVTRMSLALDYAAHIDGYFLPERSIDLIHQGKFNRVPVLVGNNRDEGNLFLLTMLITKPARFFASEKTVTDLVQKAMAARADEILAMYSFADYRKPILLLGGIMTDGFVSRGFDAAEKLSPQGPVYLYRFDWDEERLGQTLGSFHGLEIPLVFGNLDLHYPASNLRLSITRKVAAKAEPLSEQMMSYWTNFAKTGDPNGEGLPEWPKYDGGKKLRLHLDTTIAVKPVAGEDLKRLQYFAALTMDELGWKKLAEGEEEK